MPDIWKRDGGLCCTNKYSRAANVGPNNRPFGTWIQLQKQNRDSFRQKRQSDWPTVFFGGIQVPVMGKISAVTAILCAQKGSRRTDLLFQQIIFRPRLPAILKKRTPPKKNPRRPIPEPRPSAPHQKNSNPKRNSPARAPGHTGFAIQYAFTGACAGEGLAGGGLEGPASPGEAGPSKVFSNGGTLYRPAPPRSSPSAPLLSPQGLRNFVRRGVGATRWRGWRRCRP